MLLKTSSNSSASPPASQRARQAVMFGCGNMGQALLRGWSRTDQLRWIVIDPADPDLGDMADVLTDAGQLSSQSFDLAVIAVKPQLIPVVMETAGPVIRSADLVLSIAAGVSLKTLESHIGARPVIRMMPNMPAAVGKGLSGLLANPYCNASKKALIEEISSRNGEAIWLDNEDQIDRFTAIAGSGPGYVFEFLRLFTLAAMEQGFDAQTARKLAVGTVAGSAEMAAKSEQSLEALRSSVTSKNGTTEAGLAQLMKDEALRTLLSDTAKAAYARAVELR